MKKPFAILITLMLCFGCKEKPTTPEPKPDKVVFNQELAMELEKMKEVDQIAAYIQQGEYTKMSKEEWNAFKDSVFTTHQKMIEEIFDKHGFVGYDLAGEEGSDNFWLLVQHSDHDPEFQKKVLDAMKIEVDKRNASPKYYAFLVDRVNLNMGKEQVYGTQFDYNEMGQAFPKNMSDTTGLDLRRLRMGLIPMIDRMNEMTVSHFIMNQEHLLQKGIKKPILYAKNYGEKAQE
ncbi:MAG: hypothetical protein KDD31_09940 [Muricauda sp.]|nr:hypothetical protein [Allomuricauda sp.]